MIDRLLFYFRHYSFLFRKRFSLAQNIISRRLKSFAGADKLSPEEFIHIPVIINNFNRLDCLRILIQRLEKAGLKNIIILDNASSYPPLLEYYTHCPYRVIRLKQNEGFLALWKTDIWDKEFKDKYYILTDPDVVPEEDCPDDFVQHFYQLLQRFPELDKAGFSLRIDNIPAHYDLKDKVLEVERPFWQKLRKGAYYEASIDTTFALYRPGIKGGFWMNAGRSIPPYSALHLPWYQDSSRPTEEDIYYRNNAVYTKNWS